MKIIVSSQAFFPDESGIPVYSSDFAFYAASKGHDVNVVTGFSFYPSWRLRKEDKGKIFARETERGVKIFRGYTYTRQSPTIATRLIQEFFLFLCSIINYLRIGKPDVIVVFTTPVSLGILGVMFKWIFNCRLVINVQDFQVEAAQSLKMVRGSIFLRILSKLEAVSYKYSDIVASISEGMIHVLKRKGVEESKIIFWPNWVDLRLKNVSADSDFRSKYRIDCSKKIIGYSGNIGLKQGLTILIDVAKKLENEKELLFIIIGEGAGLQQLKDYSEKIKLSNMLFLPFLPQEEYHGFLEAADLIFISQIKTNNDIYFPSKLLGVLNYGKNVIVAADISSELYKVVKSNNIAFVVEYGNVDRTCEVIANFFNETDVAERMKAAADKFLFKYQREVVLDGILFKLDALNERLKMKT